MNTKRPIASLVSLAIVGVASIVYAAMPTITGVTAQQRYPWNGKVDISYTVTGDIAEEAKQQAVITSLKVSAIDIVANTTNTATQLSGDLSLAAGTHAIVWDMDAEGLPLPFKSSNIVFKVSCETTPAMYCVIDLSGGANASSYPITYLASPPIGGFNVDAYKTTKLVLKRIEAGTFIMGEDQMDESHRVTLTKPFFCGLFEMTQRQYLLVAGSNPSYFSGDKHPVEQINYNVIRGSSDGAQWPSSSAVDASSFLGKFRIRTGLDFDLPTEAQWEYACRAGTTTAYSYGDSGNENYMWAYFNSDFQTHDVGEALPNPWGLYDMHGNVWEMCLDWYADNLSVGTDPNGPSMGSGRLRRGGGYGSRVSSCTSAFRHSYNPPGIEEIKEAGFRLVRTLPNTGNVYPAVLCSGESETRKVDLASSTRTAAQVEQIRYSTAWEDGAASGATAVVEVNGETLTSATGSGYIDWTPMSNGTYTLTHKVMSGGEQVGETLTAIFLVEAIYTSAPTITGVTAQQRYPWNGKVDISYTVTGDIAEEAKQQAVITSLKVSAIDIVANTTNTATQLSGDLSLAAGTHAIVWDMDAEGLALPFKSSNIVFMVSCETTPAMYCVIDLSGGANASSYPITYLASPPSGGFNVDAYKTTKLVLKRIEAGTFIMGEDQTDESHRVTLTKPFFCGLFEVTQKQYELVMGENPSHFSGDTLPVEVVSYNDIRGSSDGSEWPSSSSVDSPSFIGKLRSRTMLDFDLPTEVQWEYACRAGTTTTYYWGDSMDGNYAWYGDNSSMTTHPGGTTVANGWGLYDMSGNVWEWCLDWYGTLTYGTDPKGSSSGSNRVRRGGGWSRRAGLCASSFRSDFSPSSTSDGNGFRLVRTLSNMGNVYPDMLCSGVSEMGKVDLASSARTAAQTEQICYSSTWEDGAAADATAVVEVNGETLNSATGSGYVDWSPMSNGTYTLTHKVMSGGEQVGETLTAIFLVEAIYTSTQTTPVPVPYAWLTQYEPDIVDEYEAYEAAANATAANGRNKVWECFVAGICPTNETARFTAKIEMQDGAPVVTWEPDLNESGTKSERLYKIYGRESLGAENPWQYPTNSLHRFFKVTVEMP